MPKGEIFWILMLFWLITWFMWNFGGDRWGTWGGYANSWMFFALFFLLGWHNFGFIIR